MSTSLSIQSFISPSESRDPDDFEQLKNTATANANIENWKWRSKEGWVKAADEWQAFFETWRNSSDRNLGSGDQGSQTLSLASLEAELLDINLPPNKILIRKSYDQLFRRILDYALHPLSYGSGVLITGQPGTGMYSGNFIVAQYTDHLQGKTLFLFYLLVRLLQLKQVVAFSVNGRKLLLFFHDTVYSATTDDQRLYLPSRAKSSDHQVFTWSLFDVRDDNPPSHPLLSPVCFPVQTASPNLVRYKVWNKERMPLHVGLPMWEREELRRGLEYQPYYELLWTVLGKINSAEGSTIERALSRFPGASRILLEHYQIASGVGEEILATSPQGALHILLDTAIQCFGHAARDVFGAIKNFDEAISHHTAALSELNLSSLQDAAMAFQLDKVFPDPSLSCQVLAIKPVFCGDLCSDSWSVNFKSHWIKKSLAKRLAAAQDAEVRKTMHFFQNLPKAVALAGWFFESYAHRQLSEPEINGFWRLTKMEKRPDTTDPPTFLRRPPSLEDLQFAKIGRQVVQITSSTDMPVSEYNKYYITPPNFPLFDAFLITFCSLQNIATLWIFQMTASQTHGGSALGYQCIRKIIASLPLEQNICKATDQQTTSQRPMKFRKVSDSEVEPRVEVRYVLVAPGAGGHLDPLREWSFPKGWNDNCTQNDHRGRVYVLEIDRSLDSVDDQCELKG